MRTIILGCVTSILCLHLCLGQIKVIEVRGDVRVRHGVSQDWQLVRGGDILKPQDSMKLAKRASAAILVDGQKRLTIPENVIVDLSDFRTLTQEELLLKLAMERVRSVPSQERNDELVIPQTTVIHGAEKTPGDLWMRSAEVGVMQLNGTRVLYHGGYYATCALKAKEVLRLYPELSKRVDIRLMVASALEKENLNGEALLEYTALKNEELSPKDRTIIQGEILQLKKKTSEKL